MNPRSEYMKHWRAANREKCRASQRRYYYGHIEKEAVARRAQHLKLNYGLTIDDWNALFQSQNFQCAICKATEPAGKGWHTDHDHITGIVRGILCLSCNSGLGRFKDNPELLIEAARYVRK